MSRFDRAPRKTAGRRFVLGKMERESVKGAKGVKGMKGAWHGGWETPRVVEQPPQECGKGEKSVKGAKGAKSAKRKTSAKGRKSAHPL
jgi:hypothetical protein